LFGGPNPFVITIQDDLIDEEFGIVEIYLLLQAQRIPPRQSQLSGPQDPAKDLTAGGFWYFFQKG
jgi:hypothetical protein